MSNIATEAPDVKAAPKPRKKPARTLNYNALVGALYMSVGKDEYAYWIDPLPHDLGPAFRCYRLSKFAATRKAGQPDHYDVSIDRATGAATCECLGSLRWPGTRCKHVAALLALLDAGKLS